MSRTTLLCSVIAALLIAVAPAAAATPRWAAGDRVPHELPSAGAARAAAAGSGWIVGARPSATTTRLAAAAGARARHLAGAYSVPASRARGFALALQRRGLLRFSEPDARLTDASAFEGGGLETAWARGAIVPATLTPPPSGGAKIGIVDDLVDATVPDTAQVKVTAHSATKQVLASHGTEVASVAAGQANGTGVLGIMPGAPLVSYGLKDSTCSEVSDGIIDTAAAGAKVLNLSLGTTEDCFLLQLAVADAFATDTLVVASSGNEFASGNPIVYPAAYPHVLSVGAVDQALQPTYFSTSNAALDLAAPGQEIPVALPPALDKRDGRQDGVSTDDGTSFAAPIVAGVASWVIATRPKLAPGQVSDLLRHSAKDLETPGWDASTGFGLVNLEGALAAPTPAVDPLEPNDGITFVDGTAYTKPDPFVWTGGGVRTIKASVDPVEDPVDVYRFRLAAGRRATLRLTPSAGNADLRAYDGSAKGLQQKALAKSTRGTGKTDIVHVTNRRGRARTFYVAVVAPALASRSFDAPYTLKLTRG